MSDVEAIRENSRFPLGQQAGLRACNTQPYSVRHGVVPRRSALQHYSSRLRSESNRAVFIRYEMPRDAFITLVIEDEAPPFNPLLVPDPPSPQSLEDISGGGQGIRLLKQFANEVKYERKPSGNRLIISFDSPGSSRTIPQTTAS